jgi:hypothetical protein
MALGGAAELLMGLVENFGATEAAMESVVSLVAVLLPPGNEVPSYKSLKTLISRVGDLKFNRHPICSSCNLFIFDVEDQRENCPRHQCQAERDRDFEKEFIYFPLKNQLERLMEDESLQQYFKRAHLQPESMDGVTRTIKDSPFWKRWVLDSGFADTDGGVVLGTSGDGAPPWKRRGRLKYSVYFMASEILNFPYKIMSDYKNR